MLSYIFHSFFAHFIILLCLSKCTHARYYYDQCCSDANDAKSLFTLQNTTFLPLTTSYTTCGQQFNVTIAPATSVFVKYSACKSKCSGFGLSQANQPNSWAGAIVNFILPSLIFSMSIPRRNLFVPMTKIDQLSLPGAEKWYRTLLQYSISFIWSILLAILTALDTLIWVAFIFVLAGPMMVSGLTEALLDYRILRALALGNHNNLNRSSKLRLIVSVVSGNLLLPEDGRSQALTLAEVPDPLSEVPNALDQLNHPLSSKKQQLLDLMSAQGDFGALVGAPVIFYLGGFIYSILDLLNDTSSQAAAISLAFGVEWMVLVHVAIISGCLLASNNPSAVSVLVGRAQPEPPRRSALRTIFHFPRVYETRFQPVSMWQRGSNKGKWLEGVITRPTDHSQLVGLNRVFKNASIGPLSYWFLIILPTIVLISLPPAAGAVVAWKTPPVGWSCRSLTFICYAACQLLVTAMRELIYEFPFEEELCTIWRDRKGRMLECIQEILYYMLAGFLRVLFVLFCFLSLFTAMGGTLMQIMGVYVNCLCYVNTNMWFRLDEAYVNVASDTLEQRNSSSNWIAMGVVATGFMGACSYFGWWYQKKIRSQYRQRVNEL